MGEDQRRMLIAFLFIIVILLFWNILNKPKAVQKPEQIVSPETLTAKVKEPSIIAGDTIVFENNKIKIVLSTLG